MLRPDIADTAPLWREQRAGAHLYYERDEMKYLVLDERRMAAHGPFEDIETAEHYRKEVILGLSDQSRVIPMGENIDDAVLISDDYQCSHEVVDHV